MTKPTDYGIPKGQVTQSILLLSGDEMLAICNVLKMLLQREDYEPLTIMKAIEEMEKPFRLEKHK
jgi:hypothetical protein